MQNERAVPFFVESERGHDTLEVPQDKVAEEVVAQLQDEKWVTIEKKDGETEILTPQDLPTLTEAVAKPTAQAEEEDEEEDLGDINIEEIAQEPKEEKPFDWKEKFGTEKPTATPKTATKTAVPKPVADKFRETKSVTATNKVKPG